MDLEEVEVRVEVGGGLVAIDLALHSLSEVPFGQQPLSVQNVPLGHDADLNDLSDHVSTAEP